MEEIKFNVELLKGKKVAVSCKNKNEAISFMDFAFSLKEEINDILIFPSSVLPYLSFIIHDNLELEARFNVRLRNDGYKIISYEDAILN